MNAYVTARARDKIGQLAGQGLGLPTFWQESAAVLARVVPHYTTPCWWTLDPASLLVTSHYQPEMVELPPEMLIHEYLADDVHKLADIARSERGISTLHEVTGGDPSQSPGWQQFIRPYGGTRKCSSPCGRDRARPGAWSGSTANRIGRCSLPRSS